MPHRESKRILAGVVQAVVDWLAIRRSVTGLNGAAMCAIAQRTEAEAAESNGNRAELSQRIGGDQGLVAGVDPGYTRWGAPRNAEWE